MTPYLLVDGVRVLFPEYTKKPRFRYRLRLPAHNLRLVSGSASPADLSNSPDTRRLGVLLRRLSWERDGTTIDVPVDSHSLIDGFHHVEIHDPNEGPVRWTTGDAALPASIFPPWEGEVVLNLSLSEWQGSSRSVTIDKHAAVLGEFEGLGEDCEFGLAQRNFLIEPPLSLFRWGGAPVENLVQGLETGFAGLTDPKSTTLVWGLGQYFVQTPYGTMHTNCIRKQDAAGEAELLACTRATLNLLRRKLLSDISGARRIFVYKSLSADFGEAEMRRLHAALRGIGPAALLCVAVARYGEPVGGIKQLADGLYVGYLSQFVIPKGPYAEWLSVCAATIDLHRHLTQESV